MNELDALSLVLEVLSVTGTSLAAVALVATLVVRVIDSSWQQTQAVIGHDVAVPTVHWITDEDVVLSRELDPDELRLVGNLEEAPAFYSRRSPEHLRFTRMSGGQRALWLIFGITAVVGLGSTVVSTAVMFFEN